MPDHSYFENLNLYVYTPQRPLAEIDADLKRAEDEILRLLQEVTT
jgi:type I restriction enzyme M protein